MSAHLEYRLLPGPPDWEDPGLARLASRLRALGFERPFGLHTSSSDEQADSLNLLDAAKTTVAEVSDFRGQPHVRFWSLLPAGDIVETALAPDHIEGIDDGIDEPVARYVIDVLVGRTVDRVWADRPRAGVHRAWVAETAEALLERHTRRVAELGEPVPLHPELVLAMHRRHAHILEVEVATSNGGYEAWKVLTHLLGAALVVGPAAWLGWWGLLVGIVLGAAWWGLLRAVLLVIYPYRVGLPILRHLSTPERVPADRLEETYRGD